jgi:hypothetical protein
MASKISRPQTNRAKKTAEVRLKGNRLATFDKGVAMIRTGPSIRIESFARRSDEAGAMLRKTAKALTKPGISKLLIFKGHKSGKIFAYSADPLDATKVIRESWDGTRRTGKVVGRKFKLA